MRAPWTRWAQPPPAARSRPTVVRVTLCRLSWPGATPSSPKTAAMGRARNELRCQSGECGARSGRGRRSTLDTSRPRRSTGMRVAIRFGTGAFLAAVEVNPSMVPARLWPRRGLRPTLAGLARGRCAARSDLAEEVPVEDLHALLPVLGVEVAQGHRDRAQQRVAVLGREAVADDAL